MAGRKIEEINCEIESLNLDDLDVEELERRLELSTGMGTNLVDPLPTCDVDGGGGGGGCGTDCGTNVCVGLCSALCAALCSGLCGCNSACGIDLY